MESFRTTINIEPDAQKITYKNKVLFFGSCFTENIGNQFTALKMPADVNPFGIIYNPVSIKNSIEILLQNKRFTTDDLLFFNEKWISFYHHSRFSNADSGLCLEEINNRINYSSLFLKEAEFIILTFGTARIYTHIKTNKPVSNCHKIPSNEFNIQSVSVNEIVEDYKILIQDILKINTNVKIIFTVSPVRHWKDGAEINQKSKATLLVAIHELVDIFKNVSYFPSYEIMMDDLRDYRFYANDMLHPNQAAINYIWEKFSDKYFDDDTILIQKEIEKINRAMMHRPFNKDSESYRKFQQTIFDSINILEKKYPFINFSDWKDFRENDVD